MSLNQSFEEILMDDDFEDVQLIPPVSPLLTDTKLTDVPAIMVPALSEENEEQNNDGARATYGKCLEREKIKFVQLQQEMEALIRQKEEERAESQTQELLLNENQIKEEIVKGKESEAGELECEVTYLYAPQGQEEIPIKSNGLDKEKKNELIQLSPPKELAKAENFLIACQRFNYLKMKENKEKHQESEEKPKSDGEVQQKKESIQAVSEKELAAAMEIKRKNFLIACQRFNYQKVKPSKEIIPLKKQKVSQEMGDGLENEDVGLQENPFFEDFFATCKFNAENYKCEGGFKATMVCVEKKCENQAYICANEACETCKENHKECFLKFTMSMMTEALNRNLSRQKAVAREVFDVQEAVLVYIAQRRQKLRKYLCLQGAKSNMLSTLLAKKEEDQKIQLKGGDILNILDSFSKDEGHDDSRLISLRQKLKGDKQSIRNILDKEVRSALKPFNPFEMAKLESHLGLTAPETKFVVETLGYPKEIKLVYRASEHEFNLNKFHQLCDNLEDTLTIIKTEHDKLIGGFTPLPWKTKHGRDKSNRTFMMAINVMEKLEPIRLGECAIHYDEELGPCFGGLFEQRDLEIFKDYGLLCCKTNFPNSYNWKRQFQSCQQSWRFLTGVKEGKQCQVMDFQVFKVIYPRLF